MPNDDQAQADLPEVTKVDDPLDAPITQKGTNEFDAYEAEREALLNAPEEEAQGDKPEPEPEETPEEEAQPEDEPEKEEELPETEEPETAEVKTQMRPRLHDPVDIAVAAIAKAKGISLIEAVRIYEQANPTTPDTEAATETGQRETVESVTAEMADLKTKRKDAFAALEFETVAELDDQLESLRDKREELRIHEAGEKSRAQQAEAEKFDAAYSKSERLTATYYPDAIDPESKLTKRMIELDSQMRELGDPLYHSPDKPFLLAKAAARELGVMMVKPDAAKPKPTSSKSPMQPASGNARTAPTSNTDKLAERIANATTLEEYEQLVGRG